jgi:hypothetical protein
MYMDYELSYQEQMTLAEKFSPQLYFDLLEVYRPRDIRDFLEHADLKNSSGGLVNSTPTPGILEEYAGTGHYLDLDNAYHTTWTLIMPITHRTLRFTGSNFTRMCSQAIKITLLCNTGSSISTMIG